MSVALNRVSVNFGSLQVLEELSLHFADGEISVVLGPSGCGKTTILNLLTSMVKSGEGEVSGIGGKRFSYLFQASSF